VISFVFNPQTISTARHRCSFLKRLDVVGCKREIVERVKKTACIHLGEDEGITTDIESGFLKIVCDSQI
jgi:hypothetical protein